MPARSARVGRLSGGIHRRLAPAVLLCYLLALFVPEPGARLRGTALGLLGLRVDASALALFLILFAAAFQVPPGRALAAVRQSKAVLAGLAAHLLTAFALAPATALVMLRRPIAASLLRHGGRSEVYDLLRGYAAWVEER